MKIRIEETAYEGSAAEILAQIQSLSFVPNEFGCTDSYINFVQDNFERMTGMPCGLPSGTTEERAKVLLEQLSKIGALEVEHDG